MLINVTLSQIDYTVLGQMLLLILATTVEDKQQVMFLTRVGMGLGHDLCGFFVNNLGGMNNFEVSTGLLMFNKDFQLISRPTDCEINENCGCASMLFT